MHMLFHEWDFSEILYVHIFLTELIKSVQLLQMLTMKTEENMRWILGEMKNQVSWFILIFKDSKEMSLNAKDVINTLRPQR